MLRNQLRQTGIACLGAAALILAVTAMSSPMASADPGLKSSITSRFYQGVGHDALAKRNHFEDIDLLVQKEVLLSDGVTYSDADSASAPTSPSIDNTPVDAELGPKLYNVTDTSIPTIREGSTAIFRIRVYPRRWDSGSIVTITDTSSAADSPGANCSHGPVSVAADTMIEYTCTVPNVLSIGTGTPEDLVNTISVSSTDPSGNWAVTASDTAAVNVVKPCIAVKKYVRQAGSTTWNDADTVGDAVSIPLGATAQWRIVTSNCGEMTLANVTVADNAVPGCNRVIESLLPGASDTIDSTTLPSCVTTNVSAALTNTATATGQPVIDAKPAGSVVTAGDPANIKAVEATTTSTTTTTTTTAAPPTEATTSTTTTTTTPATPPARPAPPAFAVIATTIVPTPSSPASAAPAATPSTAPATTTVPPSTVVATTQAAPSVSVLGVQIAQTVNDGPLAITGSNHSRALLLVSVLTLLAGVALVMASRTSNRRRE